ncbi:MAG: ABC transporter ATP-binding protein/permease [Flavobacteriales bacterium]|nr:ABC transporter ATP-binding protein/permease [Flavobacteriales bacterium]
MKSLLVLNKYFLRYKYHFFLGILFITISNVFAIYPAAIIRQALDEVMDGINTLQLFKNSSLYSEVVKNIGKGLFYFSVIIISMALLKGLFMFFMRQTIIVMSRLIEYDMKNEIYEHYQKLSLSFYKRNNTGDLMNRISEDVSRVRMYIGPAIMYSINLLVLFVLVIYTMIRVNPKLTLFVLMPLPILSIAVYFVNSTILRKSEEVQAKLSVLSSFVQEVFSGIRILKAYNRINIMGFRFEHDADDYKEKNLSLVKFNAVFFPLIMLLIGVSTLIVVWVGGMEVARGAISPGVIAEFIIYVNMLTWPVASIGWVTSIIQRAAASQIRINEFMQTQPEIVSEELSIYPLKGEIQFKRVSFTYPDTGIIALKNLSFHIPAGKTLAILGRTGAGKSTVAHLLMRFYDVSDGQILIDGKDIRYHDLSVLRNNIGYVPQDVFLFSDTIRNNIVFGLHTHVSSEMIDEQVIQAAKDADIHDNIMQFPEKYQTRIGERGITLSGGQKQRISIARAIIKNPRILIFDDCLSAVDAETEEKILKNLLRLMHGKTTLLISHRISTVKTADHILVLDEGTLVEEGTHESLMKLKGVYYDLYQKQVKEDKIDLIV